MEHYKSDIMSDNEEIKYAIIDPDDEIWIVKAKNMFHAVDRALENGYPVEEEELKEMIEDYRIRIIKIKEEI